MDEKEIIETKPIELIVTSSGDNIPTYPIPVIDTYTDKSGNSK